MSSTAFDRRRSPQPMPLNRLQEKGLGAPASDAQVHSPRAFGERQNASNAIPAEFYPGERRSLSGIALRAFLLGTTLGACFILSISLAYYYETRLWRVPFFLSILSVFHFLEFWTTARYNTQIAYVSSYLLTNGDRYRQANILALTETVLTSYFLPNWQSRFNPPWVIVLGITITLIGQGVRSLAMVQAGTNFNHHVQHRKNEGHELVTNGMYSVFRHPAYFGYFWWALGIEIALGNIVSLTLFSPLLWYFFSQRVEHEEKHLVYFFGDDYVAYKKRTKTWIPFVG